MKNSIIIKVVNRIMSMLGRIAGLSLNYSLVGFYQPKKPKKINKN